jgi:hypothetical protein
VCIPYSDLGKQKGLPVAGGVIVNHEDVLLVIEALRIQRNGNF